MTRSGPGQTGILLQLASCSLQLTLLLHIYHFISLYFIYITLYHFILTFLPLIVAFTDWLSPWLSRISPWYFSLGFSFITILPSIMGSSWLPVWWQHWMLQIQNTRKPDLDGWISNCLSFISADMPSLGIYSFWRMNLEFGELNNGCEDPSLLVLFIYGFDHFPLSIDYGFTGVSSYSYQLVTFYDFFFLSTINKWIERADISPN